MFSLNKKQLHNQEGVVLVMSLMILLVMVTSVVALSQVIIGEIKMTRNADNSIIAFYAAESGIEKTMYFLKYAKEEDDFTFFNRLGEAPYSSGVIDNERGFIIQQASSSAPYYETYYVTTSTPARVDIVQPGENIPAASVGLPQSYKLEWRIDDCLEDDHASDKLEISYTSLYKDGGDNLQANTHQVLAVCGCGPGSDSCIDYTSNNLDDNKAYYFSFRPLNDMVTYLKFTPYTLNDLLGEPYLPSELDIAVDGYYRQSLHNISVRLPAFSPVTDVLMYVIFSESDLEKGF
jgi:hypothetical protein